MDKKCILFITILTKLEGYMRGKMQEEIIFLMSIVIGKENFSNKECKVLHMHVGFVLL
jgi:hypothetical protein